MRRNPKNKKKQNDRIKKYMPRILREMLFF